MDFMKLKATLSLDSSEYEQGLDKAESKTGKLKKGLANFGKVSAVAIGAATVATAALVKKSVQAYAEYEQLAGGVEKLFGDKASKQVMKYAQNAYKTAGMSANQYMEQATSFSAALINSLNGDQMAAAHQTDVAMKAISDNFNTFGGDIQNVQNAYQGFAKQNYTMLDNLKLGYGGTKTEMERLIADANEYAAANGMAADLSIESFSDIVTAIDLVQQKQGIAGTTAKEAAKTIEGSLNMTKAAWQNLVVGFTDPNADIGKLASDLLQSVGIAAKNVVPAVGRALKGIGQAIVEYAPTLINEGVNAIAKFAEGIGEGEPEIILKVVDIVLLIAETIIKNLPKIIKAAAKLIVGFAKGLINSLPKVVSSVAKIGSEVVKGLGSAIWGKVKEAAEGIKRRFLSVIDTIKDGASSAFESVKNTISEKLEAAKSIVTGWINTIKGLFPFNIGKIFSGWVPKISLHAKKSEDGTSASTDTTVTNQYFAKAMSQPYLFNKPTILNQIAGDHGDEMLYGRSALMRDIAEASGGGTEITNYFDIYDATNPDDVADAIVTRLKLQMRSA